MTVRARLRPPTVAQLFELAGIAAIVALQFALSARLLHNATNYDEAVYLAAVDAMRHGQELGRDVFAAQFPGFYDLLDLLSRVAGLTVAGLRAGLLAVVGLGTAGAWLIGRRYGGPLGGAITAGLLVVAPPLDLFAPQVIADTPAIALALLAVGLATISAPVAIGAAGVIWALALSVKLTAVTALVPLIWFARRRLKLLLLGALAGGIAILALHVTALGSLWASGVRYHELARSTPEVIPHPYRQILDQMPRATPFPWLVLAAALTATALALVGTRRDLWPLWTWALLNVAFLLVHQPLHYNHLVIVPVSLGVAAGATFASVAPRHRVVTLLLALVLVAAFAQQWRRVGAARDTEPATNTAAASALARLTPASALTVDDRPIISFLARRRVVGSLVDLAALRYETRSLTDEKVMRGIGRAEAVVISRTLRDRPRVLRFVRAHFRRRYDHGGVEIWVRRP